MLPQLPLGVLIIVLLDFVSLVMVGQLELNVAYLVLTLILILLSLVLFKQAYMVLKINLNLKSLYQVIYIKIKSSQSMAPLFFAAAASPTTNASTVLSRLSVLRIFLMPSPCLMQ